MRVCTQHFRSRCVASALGVQGWSECAVCKVIANTNTGHHQSEIVNRYMYVYRLLVKRMLRNEAQRTGRPGHCCTAHVPVKPSTAASHPTHGNPQTHAINAFGGVKHVFLMALRLQVSALPSWCCACVSKQPWANSSRPPAEASGRTWRRPPTPAVGSAAVAALYGGPAEQL